MMGETLYVEAMARALFEDQRAGMIPWSAASEMARVSGLSDAKVHLAALIAELRADPGAVEAMAKATFKADFGTGWENAGQFSREVRCSDAAAAIAALADYLAGSGG
jgi:hypothetical protein